MTNFKKVKRNIMLRVYWSFFLNKIKEPLVWKVSLLIVFIVTSVFSVSITNVFMNSPWYSMAGLYNFYMYAFMYTEVFTKLLLIIGLALIGTITKDLFRGYMHRKDIYADSTAH